MACPICKKEPQAKYRPFCSKRCADIDLGKWMTGQYAVPSTREEDPAEIEDAIEAELKSGDRKIH